MERLQTILSYLDLTQIQTVNEAFFIKRRLFGNSCNGFTEENITFVLAAL